MSMPASISRAEPTFLWGLNHNQQHSFEYITWLQLCECVRNPVLVEKNDAPVLGPFDAPAKRGDVVKAHNNFTLLVADLDIGNPCLQGAADRLKALGLRSFAIYSSARHQTEGLGNRWRVLVPITCGIEHDRWSALQGFLCQELDGDNCAIQKQQIAYMPNWGKGGYEYLIEKGPALDPLDESHPLVLKALQLQAEQEAELVLIEAQKPPPAPRNDPSLAGVGQISVIDAYNAAHDIKEVMASYGYRQRGKKWLHPNSSSGSPGVWLLPGSGRYYSKHGCDPLADGKRHDAFDLFAQFEHGGNQINALKAAADMLTTTEGITLTKHNQREYMRHKEAEATRHGSEQAARLLASDLSPLDMLDDMELTMKQAEALADSNFIIDNMVIEGHVVAICAPPNGGKTTILFDRSREMVEAGYIVRYIHADVGPGEAKAMLALAKARGFKYITPDYNPDGSKDISYVRDLLAAMVEKATPLNGVVFQIDTLKKMADMMSKGSLKNLLKLFRQLTGLGATVILLCHTNKHKDGDGMYVFEGVGDLRADVDELIYFIPKKNADDSMTVSTMPDKVRGIFSPITYEVSPTREVTLQRGFIDTGAENAAEAQLKKDQDILDTIKLALEAKQIKQTDVCDWVREYWGNNRDDARPGERRIIAVLKRYKQGNRRQWYSRPGMQKNRIEYSLVPFDGSPEEWESAEKVRGGAKLHNCGKIAQT